MQIRIYLDGTFESLSAVDTKAELATLKADLKIIIQVEKLRAARTDAKRMANTAKDKELLGKIKSLKAKLSSNRNSSQDIINAKIGKLKDVVAAPKLTRSNKTGDPRRNPTRLKSPRSTGKDPATIAEERVKAARPARQTAKVKERLRDLETKIGILEDDLSKVPKGAKHNLRREMLSENLADAKKQVQSLERTGKEAVLPARTSAPAKKQRVVRESAEDAADRRKRQAIELVQDKIAQTRDPKKLTALRAELKALTTGKPEAAAETRDQRFVKTFRQILSGGDTFTDTSGKKKFRGMTALDINAELKHYPEFARVKATTELQMLLRKAGLNVQVNMGYRDGKGKRLYVWTV